MDEDLYQSMSNKGVAKHDVGCLVVVPVLVIACVVANWFALSSMVKSKALERCLDGTCRQAVLSRHGDCVSKSMSITSSGTRVNAPKPDAESFLLFGVPWGPYGQCVGARLSTVQRVTRQR